MVTIRFPFDIEHPDIRQGVQMGQEERFQSTKPASDTELVDLIRDLFHDDPNRLRYNVGFLLSLYIDR